VSIAHEAGRVTECSRLPGCGATYRQAMEFRITGMKTFDWQFTTAGHILYEMVLPKILILTACAALCATAGQAQTAGSPAPASSGEAKPPDSKPPDEAPAASPLSLGPVQFSALVDGYYDLNFNHPASGNNQIRNFDVKANQFSLNMLKLTMEHTADPVGFRVDLGFGKAFDVIHATDKAFDSVRYIEQAYISLKPPKAKGLQIDFGKFVTSAGAEVIETNANWNYSRSLLFAWAIPYYHFGVRTSMPVGKYFTGGFQVVNGWNNVEDNNSGKTVGLTAAFATSKVTWSTNYYAGPEKNGTNVGWRQLFDTTLVLTPRRDISFYINYDYGRDKYVDRGAANWNGLAGAARFQLSRVFALAPRIEYFDDSAGFSTGVAQRLAEATVTGEFKLNDYAVTRLEYRHDWSNQRFFDRGGSPAAAKSQDTVLVGIVAAFGPKR
jgi:hypothetical protein